MTIMIIIIDYLLLFYQHYYPHDHWCCPRYSARCVMHTISGLTCTGEYSIFYFVYRANYFELVIRHVNSTRMQDFKCYIFRAFPVLRYTVIRIIFPVIVSYW